MVKLIFKQTSWQVIGKIITSLSTIVTLGIIARVYGPANTGIFTLALTFLAFFYLAADMGLNAFVLPKLTDGYKEANLLFNLRINISVILVLVAIILAFILPFNNLDFSYTVLIGSLSIIFYGIFNTTNLVFQKSLRYDKTTFASIAGALSSVPIVYLLSINHSPIYLLAIALVVNWLVNNIVALILIRKDIKFHFLLLPYKYFLDTFYQAWPIILTLVVNTIYFRVDAFILSSLKGFSDVGIYNLSYQIFQAALVLPTFIMNAFYPLLVKNYSENRRQFYSQIKSALFLMFGISIVVAITTWVLAPLIVSLLAGDGFVQSTVVLRILAFGFPAFFVSSLLMWICLSIRKYQSMFFVYSLGLVINLFLNLSLIPKYSYIGAAWVTNISEYLILVLLVIILFNNFKHGFNN